MEGFKCFLYCLLAQTILITTAAGSCQSLFVNTSETLVINTTAGITKHLKKGNKLTMYGMFLQNLNYDGYQYSVARLVFKGDVTFEVGSQINVTGAHALSISSQKGDITIKTPIRVTCHATPAAQETCLGGYTVSSSPIKNTNGRNLYPGAGPGASYKEVYLQNLDPKQGDCMPSAGHGGYGAAGNASMIPSYGRTEDNTLGGSGGICYMYRGQAAGGGAIELAAVNGTINIESIVAADAQEASQNCSGGSGGLIRLKAKQVIIKGTLSAVGASGGVNLNNEIETHGGAGGVIQIISANGIIHSGAVIRLAKGNKTCKNDPEDSEHGFLLLKDSKWTVLYNITVAKSLPIDSLWWGVPYPTTSSIPGSSGVTYSTDFVRSASLIMSSHASHSDNEGQTIPIKINPTERSSTANFESTVSANHGTIHNTSKSTTSTMGLENATIMVSTKYLQKYSTKSPTERSSTANFESTVTPNHGTIYSSSLSTTMYPSSVPMCFKDAKRRSDGHNGKKFNFLNLAKELNESCAENVNKRRTLQQTSVHHLAWITQHVPPNITKNVDIFFNDTNLDKGKQSWISLPYRVFDMKGSFISVLLYTNTTQLLPNDPHVKINGVNMKANPITPVLSITVMPRLPPKLKENITIGLQHLTNLSDTDSSHCVFWDYSIKSEWNGSWSSRGCSVKKRTNELTICVCNHLTCFAVLMRPANVQIPEDNEMGLEIMTYIGISLSILGNILSLITQWKWADSRKQRPCIRMNVVTALTLAQIAFLTGIDLYKNLIGCVVAASLIQYLFLVVFCWMLLEGIHLYHKVTTVFPVHLNMPLCYLFAWGFPLVCVGVSILIGWFGADNDIRGYIGEDICWLSIKHHVIWIFVGFLAFVVLVNIAVVCCVVLVLFRRKHSQDTKLEKLRRCARSCVILLPLLGITWVFGLLRLAGLGTEFEYIFTVLNSMQGFLILVCHGQSDPKVKEKWNAKKTQIFGLCQFSSSTSTKVQVIEIPVQPANQNEAPVN